MKSLMPIHFLSSLIKCQPSANRYVMLQCSRKNINLFECAGQTVLPRKLDWEFEVFNAALCLSLPLHSIYFI